MIKKLLLDAPDGQLDNSLFPLIETFDDEPTAAQMLKLLDFCVFIGGASEFTMLFLRRLLEMAVQREGTTYDEVCKLADETWRKESPFAGE